MARQLEAEGLVERISAETVRRVLARNALKPWRWHHWLSAKAPRDAAFADAVTAVCDLYTRPLGAHEAVLCVDEKTSIQPRCRVARTRAAQARRPVQVEQGYRRDGALNLFAAFDTRSGRVIGWNSEQKRADEFIAFLELLDATLAPHLSAIHVILDNLRVHKSKAVAAWLAHHPRFLFYFPPVHCSWLNQVEQWFSILARKALQIADCADLRALDRHIHRFLAHWNARAHPFNWTTSSITKIMAKCKADDVLAAVA